MKARETDLGSSSGYRWLILFTVWFSFLSTQIARYVIPPLIPVLRQTLDLTAAQAGIVVSSFWAPYAATQFLAGTISDRMGVKKTQVVTLTLAAVFSMAMGFASGYDSLITLRFLSGLASGFIYAPGTALLLRWFDAKDRSLANGLYSTATGLGPAIPMLSCAALAALFGWRFPFWFLGSTPLVAAVVAFILIKEEPETSEPTSVKQATSPDAGHPLRSSVAVLRSKLLWCDSIASLGTIFTYQGATTWAASYIVDSLGLNLTIAGLIASLLTIGVVAGNLAGGLIPGKIVRRNAPTALMAMTALGILSLTLAIMPNLTATTVTILFLAFGFFHGMTAGPLSSMIAEFIPDPKTFGAAAGLKNTLGHVGSTLAVTVFGVLLDLTGSYTYPWIALGAVALVSSLALLPLIHAGH